MNLDDVSPDIRARAEECKTPEEILELAKEAGYKLSDEELEAISGGGSMADFWTCADNYWP